MRWYMDEVHYFTAHSSSCSSNGGTNSGSSSTGSSSASGGEPRALGWYSSGPIGAPGPHAPFDSPFYLILNLAVGGPSTVFTGGAPLGDTLAQPKQLLVDYVRVHGLPYVLSQAQPV